MLQGLVAGSTDTAALADLALGRLRDKLQELQRALSGRLGAHQRFLIAQQLAHIDALDAAIKAVEQETAERLRPVADILGTTRHDSWRRHDDRAGPQRRDRYRYDPVSVSRLSGVLGKDVPR
jgi:transposase